MLGRPFRSLRARVVAAILVLTGLAGAMALIIPERELRESHREAAEVTTIALARAFDAAVAPAALRDPAALQVELARLRDTHRLVIEASVYRAPGGRVVRTATTGTDELDEPVGGRDAEALRTGRPLYEEKRDDSEHVAELVYPLASDRTAALGLVYDLGPSDRALEERRVVIAVGVGLVVVLFLVAVNLLLARAVFRPLDRLRTVAQAIRAGDLEARVGWQRDDELGQLGADFDAMATELRDLVLEDALTGLPNQRACWRRLDHELARAARDGIPISVALLDVDRFKAINDTQGHAAGDEALRALAAALRRELRPADVFGRLGGDEFLVALVGADVAEAEVVLERLRDAVAQQPPRADAPPLTISVGLAAFPDQALEADDLLRLADRALYRAKAEGRDRVRAYAEV